MGVNNSWRQPVTMNDWMRDIEKRLMHEERRPTVAAAFDVVGPGISTYTKPVDDWNSQGPTVNGFFYSIGDQVINSPDDSLYWIGMVEANPIGQGIQRVWEYLQDDGDPTTPLIPVVGATNWQRTFVTNADGTRTYTAWTQGGGSGGGGIAGIVVQDEGATVASAATQLDFQGPGVTATAGVGEVVVTIPGGAAAFYHEQQYLSGTSHISYTHGQGTKGVEVEFWDLTGRQRFGDVTKPDVNTVIVDFYFPLTGTLIVYGAVA